MQKADTKLGGDFGGSGGYRLLSNPAPAAWVI